MVRLGFVASCVFVSLCPMPGAAQSPQPSSAQSFSASVGLAASGRLDETASPFRFAGHGAEFALGYERSGAQYSFAARLSGGPRALSVTDVNTGLVEELNEARLDLTLVRAMRGRSEFTRGLSLGMRFSAVTALNSVAFSNDQQDHSDYFLAAASIGPAASWQRDIRGGQLSLNVAVPLVALVDHPFSDVRDQSKPAAFHAASLGTYRELNGGVSYVRPFTRTLGLVYSYHIGLLHLDDQQPLHTVTQTLSVGIMRRGARSTP